MKVTVKILQGSECNLEVSGTTRIRDLKDKVEIILNVSPSAQRLVFRGKTLTDETSLEEAGITDGAKIHLMVKKGELSSPSLGASSSNSVSSNPTVDFFAQLDTFLRKHLTQEQTTQVVNEFRKNCQLMMDSMNFDDIERFAASNFTEF
ncbi:ubiquitin-like protein 4A [Penaeus vannamei]|uniref:Putative ubiquitin-like protein 4A-like n=1 Tax=Penaeus vannamei TaxID=6689 RepID=A0A3R7M3W9_PENVA|nr:ubiquitin-like protein 4A [Penaeus vannamei]ROT72183.1 putative ubiquitin-like protein 4A-like [Penaeus vannamei]